MASAISIWSACVPTTAALRLLNVSAETAIPKMAFPQMVLPWRRSGYAMERLSPFSDWALRRESRNLRFSQCVHRTNPMEVFFGRGKPYWEYETVSSARRHDERGNEWNEPLAALHKEPANHMSQEFMASLISKAVMKAIDSRRMALSASDYEDDHPDSQEVYAYSKAQGYEALTILVTLPRYVDDKGPHQHTLSDLIELIRACAEWAVAWDENHQAKTDEQRFKS